MRLLRPSPLPPKCRRHRRCPPVTRPRRRSAVSPGRLVERSWSRRRLRGGLFLVGGPRAPRHCRRADDPALGRPDPSSRSGRRTGPGDRLWGGPGLTASTGWVAGGVDLVPGTAAPSWSSTSVAPDAANRGLIAPSSTRRSRRRRRSRTASDHRPLAPCRQRLESDGSISTATTPSRAPLTSSTCDARSASTSSCCAVSAMAPVSPGRSTARIPKGSPACSSIAR